MWVLVYAGKYALYCGACNICLIFSPWLQYSLSPVWGNKMSPAPCHYCKSTTVSLSVTFLLLFCIMVMSLFSLNYGGNWSCLKWKDISVLSVDDRSSDEYVCEDKLLAFYGTSGQYKITKLCIMFFFSLLPFTPS